MTCELCGKPSTTKARVEGAVLSVCAACVSLGTEIKSAPLQTKFKPRTPQAETVLVEEAAKRIRQARQRMKLSEKDAAQKLGIKESVLLGVESGRVHLDETLGRKLEKFYNIILYESL